jgi:hypothetical protein
MATSSQSFVPFRPASQLSRWPFGHVRAILRHIGTSIIEARRRRADAIVSAFIERRGGRLTDDLERQIERRLFSTLGS